MAAIDVTDATFQTEVVDQSRRRPVVVDLWAPWCGPCRTLGPIIEKVIDATDGKVVLVKVNVDENPGVSQAFQVQSIPAVYALRTARSSTASSGAYPEHVVEEFVAGLLPTEDERTRRIAASPPATRVPAEPHWSWSRATRTRSSALAELLVARGEADEALALLDRIPENDAHAQGRRSRSGRYAAGRSPTTTTPGSPICSTR